MAKSSASTLKACETIFEGLDAPDYVVVEEELVGRRAGGRVGRWTGSAIRKPILLRCDNEQLAKLALPRSYDCTVCC